MLRRDFFPQLHATDRLTENFARRNLTASPSQMSKRFLLCAVFIFLVACAQGQSIVTESTEPPVWPARTVYEDEEYKFVCRYFVDWGNTTPAFFVQSKHGEWLRITKITTKDGVFGAWGRYDVVRPGFADIPSVTWDFRELAKVPFAEMPLRTSGSIALPERIELLDKPARYKLGFMIDCGITGGSTHLFIEKADLDEAFVKLPRDNH